MILTWQTRTILILYEITAVLVLCQESNLLQVSFQLYLHHEPLWSSFKPMCQVIWAFQERIAVLKTDVIAVVFNLSFILLLNQPLSSKSRSPLEYLAREIPFLHFHIFFKFLSYFRWCHRVCLNGNYWNTFLYGITSMLNNWQPLSYVMSPSGIFHFMLASA